jgi:transposase
MPAYADPTPKPISADTIFLAFELSGTSWLVALHAPDADKVERHRLPAGVAAEVLGLIARTKARVTRRLGTTPRVACCYEAGRDGFWLHRVLEAEGIASHVMDPTSLQVDRRARRAKTDRLDAQALLRALMAWSRGERQVCSMVRPPSPEHEDERRLSPRARDAAQGAPAAQQPDQGPVRGAGDLRLRAARGGSPRTSGPARDRGRPRVAGPARGGDRSAARLP